ncbi:uncharacterized protein F4822DRAFT_444197 [Hypoxylon trugodes]|uniref:uncharacterized protein n=1 Tax=Hypoxylon trugodes TaxID=326681 RepID=UPI00219B489E|nr:uncharacterized protein F4822DRAFT_444197 [Hypoxylon trugodes]KAI1387564.1 hypothetical protein F4822DRAFT_444197 [Hypoxylon trugodes]
MQEFHGSDQTPKGGHGQAGKQSPLDNTDIGANGHDKGTEATSNAEELPSAVLEREIGKIIEVLLSGMNDSEGDFEGSPELEGTEQPPTANSPAHGSAHNSAHSSENNSEPAGMEWREGQYPADATVEESGASCRYLKGAVGVPVAAPDVVGETSGATAPEGDAAVGTTSYRGTDNTEQSLAVPDDDNCSLHLTNLPPDCTVAQLLGAIRGVGKIYACNIRPPSGVYTTSAAKLVFWNRQMATEFLQRVRAGQFVVGAYTPQARMNDHKVASQEESYISRVLEITGPTPIINQDYLENFFQREFSYELENVETVFTNDNISKLIIRFSSYHCQASNARRSIMRAINGMFTDQVTHAERDHWRRVRSRWGVDPCA